LSQDDILIISAIIAILIGAVVQSRAFSKGYLRNISLVDIILDVFLKDQDPVILCVFGWIFFLIIPLIYALYMVILFLPGIIASFGSFLILSLLSLLFL
jgi:hypothetical protein